MHEWVGACRVWRPTAAQTLNSRFHMDVSEKLHFMGIAHEDEFLTEDGCFSIDIVVTGPNGPVAIEVDGPYHYTINTLNPLGSTLIRSVSGILSRRQDAMYDNPCAVAMQQAWAAMPHCLLNLQQHYPATSHGVSKGSRGL